MNIVFCHEAYERAQLALVDLKLSIVSLLMKANEDGLRNVDLGKALGIYHGHQGHEGHISRSILSLLASEGVVEQNAETKKWKLMETSGI